MRPFEFMHAMMKERVAGTAELAASIKITQSMLVVNGILQDRLLIREKERD